MAERQHHDGVSDPNPGKGESGGGAWKGKNEKPAYPDEGVTTHILTETKPVRDGEDNPPG